MANETAERVKSAHVGETNTLWFSALVLEIAIAAYGSMTGEWLTAGAAGGSVFVLAALFQLGFVERRFRAGMDDAYPAVAWGDNGDGRTRNARD